MVNPLGFRLVLLSLAAAALYAQTAPRPYFSEPALAPDRPEIAFVSGGDIWRVAAAGGEASLVVSHPAQESRPLYSPDGQRLAFVSTRTGGGDIYVLTLANGELVRLTYDDSPEQLDAFSRDGNWIYFTSRSRDVRGMSDVYRVAVSGGTPMPVSADRYLNEFFAAPSPDGAAMAFSARGVAGTQWWRRGHSHLDEGEIWLRRAGAKPSYERLVAGGAKNMWPMWPPDGRSIYYVSDTSGAENLWQKPLAGAARRVTNFQNGRLLWPAIAWDGRGIVFERGFGIWKLDLATGKAGEVPITLRGTPAGPAVTRVNLGGQFRELALAPDGRKVAIIARGEVFAASAKDGGEAARVTSTHAGESQIAWAPDSRRLVYLSDRDGPHHLFLYDFATSVETRLTNEPFSDAGAVFAPDGASLVFLRDGRELRLYDFEKKQDRLLATGWMEKPPLARADSLAWSPDSRWIAYTSRGVKGFANVYVVGAQGGNSRPVSFLPNLGAEGLKWSPDGTYLLFATGQRTELQQLAVIDLLPRTPRFREDQFRDLFKTSPAGGQQLPSAQETPKPPARVEDARKTPPKPVEIDFDEIRRRLRLLPVGLDAYPAAIASDGKTLLLVAVVAGQQNVYTWSLDELATTPAVARQLTSTAGAKRSAHFSPDGKEVYFIEQGRIQVATIESRQAKPLNVTAEIDVDFHREKMEVFRQAWSYQRDHFFDEKFNGVDWEAVRREFEPLAAGARTQRELHRLVNLMVGELNASHLGISPPPGEGSTTTGHLGLRFDPSEYESAGRLKVAEVIPLGPAALRDGVKAGEYLLELDGAAITARTNLDQLLEHKIGRRVELTVATAADGTGKRRVAVLPVNLNTESGLVYRAWVEERRAYVARASGGRLGYAHMPDMGSASLERLHLDLDAETHGKEGVVVDIRNNSGGFVNVYAIDVLARRPYLVMKERGGVETPARSVLGQRALELPTVLVINQHSLSDAEDFTEGYRQLKLGKVVGEPTAGWIVYTWGQALIDGSLLRMPRMKVFDTRGQLMEMNPRPVDVAVQRPVGESYTGGDIQLDTAVRELLQQIDAGRKRAPVTSAGK